MKGEKYLTPNYSYTTVSGPEQPDQPGHRAAAPHHLQAGGARQSVRQPDRERREQDQGDPGGDGGECAGGQ